MTDISKFKSSVSLKHQPTKAKISFFSSILLVIGSSIGAGIFLKNGEILQNVDGSIVLAMLCWLISIVGILAVGLALIEICSGSGVNNNQGIVGWVKTFNSKIAYQGAKNFMAFLYLPINLFVMAYYMMETLDQAFGWNLPWWALTLSVLVIILWFTIVSGLFAKAANIQNWIITSVKFLPLVFAAIIGFVYIGLGNDVQNPIWPDPNWNQKNQLPLFNQLTPIVGVFASIPAVFFAFDGFYTTAGIQAEMKEPKKSALSMSLGIAIISFIDVMISISLLLCARSSEGGGKIYDLKGWLTANHLVWLYQLIQVLIGFGILSIINGFSIYNARYYEDLIANRQLPFSHKFNPQKLNIHRPVAGVIYLLILFSIYLVVFTIVGIFYLNTNGYPTNLSWGVAGLYSFVDLIANWTSLLAFGCIVVAIVGGIKNRKTNKVKVVQRKYFKLTAYISCIICGLAIIYVIVNAFGNLVLVLHYISINKYTSYDIMRQQLVGSILELVVLFVFMAVVFVPALIKKHR